MNARWDQGVFRTRTLRTAPELKRIGFEGRSARVFLAGLSRPLRPCSRPNIQHSVVYCHYWFFQTLPTLDPLKVRGV